MGARPKTGILTSFRGLHRPEIVGERRRAPFAKRLPWSHNMGGGDYDKNVYNYRGAWTEQQCQGRWRREKRRHTSVRARSSR